MLGLMGAHYDWKTLSSIKLEVRFFRLLRV